MNYVEKMPPLPPTVGKIVEVANNPQSGIDDMVEVVSIDPVLSAKVIKLVNSPFFGLREKISTTSRAVTYLGLNAIKNLALTVLVLRNLASDSDNGGIDMEEFWRHSFACSVAARSIAFKAGLDAKTADDCMIAGLLHDIGKIVLINFSPKEYSAAVDLVKTGSLSSIAAERSAFHGENETVNDGMIPFIDHCNVGYHLCVKWRLPAVLAEPVKYHHTPLECPAQQKIVAVIALADEYCCATGYAGIGNERDFSPSQDIIELLSLTDANFDAIKADLDNRVVSVTEYLMQ